MTADEAYSLALYVSAGFRPPLSQTSLALWADAIGDLDAKIAMQAARALVCETEWPTVAGLRERYDRLARPTPPPRLALTHNPAPADPEARRSSPGLQSLRDVAQSLRKRMMASNSAAMAPRSDDQGQAKGSA